MDENRKLAPRAPSTYTLVVGSEAIVSGSYNRLLSLYNAIAAYEDELKFRNDGADISFPPYFIRAGSIDC